MKKPPRSLRPFATVAAGLLALVACQNATDSNSNSDSPVVATASFPIAVPRVPDNATALYQTDTVSNKLNCPPLGSDTSTTCTATLNLPHPLGMDSLALQLWTLGVQTYTLYFKESGNSTKLDLGSHSVASLDTLLLSGFAKLTDAQRSSFGTGPTGLVAYYASLILDKDTALVGKALPVGMSIDSVKKELVRVGVDSGKTLSQLTSLSIQLGSGTLTLDTATIRLDVSILIHAGALSSADSTALYPAYPVQVQTPIAVSGPVVSGGSPVVVSGIFTWKAGKVVSPKFEVHTAKGLDTNFTFPITNSPSTSATTWNLSNSVTLLAKSTASAGTDTLVATLSTDSGYFATSRATFQVVARDTTAPALKILSPSGDTTVPNTAAGILVKAAATDSGSGLDSIAIGSAKFASSPCTTTVALAVGVDTITVQAWDNAGNKSTAMVHVTRAKAPGDSIPPFLKITSPSKDTTVSYATTSLAITATATDSGSGMGYVMIASTKLTTAPYTATVSLGVGTDTIVVQALDNVGNKSTATVHVTRAKDTTSPVIAPGAGTTTRTVLFDTTKVQLGWTIQDSHGIDSLWLNGVAQAVSKSPSQTANLIVGPNPFVLVVMDSLGNTSRDSILITRSPDVTGPAITWVAPSASLAVDATVSSFKVQVKATDLSGVDSVYLQGMKANNDSGSYWSATLSLPSPNGVPMKVVAKAWDKLKNLSVDSTSITITRNAPSGTDKPALTLLQPSSNVGNSLPFASDTLHVVYKITDLVPLDTTTFLFGTTVPKHLTDSTWAADVPVPPTGQPTIIVIQAANTNKMGSSDQIVVTRAKDTVPPVLAITSPSKDTIVAFGTTSITVNTTASDAGSGLKSVFVNGKAVDSSGKATVILSDAVNNISAIATDNAGNADTVKVNVTVMGIVATPTFSVAGGTYTTAQSVTLATAAVASVYYTLDGSTPTATSTLYTTGESIVIDTNRTLKAIAIATGYSNSMVASAVYVINYDATLKSIRLVDAGTMAVPITGISLKSDSLDAFSTVLVSATPTASSATVTITPNSIVPMTKDTATITITVTNGSSSMAYSLLLITRHSGTFKDPRDTNSYKAVKVGAQWWMAQNLNYAGPNSDIGSCNGGISANCDTYGRIYSASIGDEVCPNGWRLSLLDDWTQLAHDVGGVDIAGQVLKSQSWDGTDAFGIDLLPAGSCSMGYCGLGTSATMSTGLATWVNFSTGNNSFTSTTGDSRSSGSIRCVMDN